MARVGAGEPRREIDDAGAAGRGGVAAEGRSGQVGIGKGYIGQLELQLALHMAPGELRGERVEIARRVGKCPRQIHARLTRIEQHAAALFVAIDVAADAGESGQTGVSAHAETVEMPAQAVALRIRQGTLPIEAHVGNAALRRSLGQCLAHLRRQRQVFAQQRQRLQRECVDAHLALFGALVVAGPPLQGKLRRRQDHSGLQFQRHLSAGNLVTALRAFRRQAPLQRAQFQQGLLGRETCADIAECHVGGGFLQAFVGKTQP